MNRDMCKDCWYFNDMRAFGKPKAGMLLTHCLRFGAAIFPDRECCPEFLDMLISTWKDRMEVSRLDYFVELIGSFMANKEYPNLIIADEDEDLVPGVDLDA